MNSADSFALIHLPVANRVAGEPTLIDLTRVQRSVRPAAAGEFIRVCSWCQSVAQGDRWVQAPAQPAAETRPITHGICPACLERLLQDQRLTA